MLPIMLLAVISLLLGIWTGWIRSGWSLEQAGAAAHHGALIVGSFLGTLITIERAVTLPRPWLIAPLINGLSLPLVLHGHEQAAMVALLLGGLGLSIIYVKVSFKNNDWYIYLLLTGALMYVAGTVMLIKTQFYATVFPWWMAFFLFTIVGERMELTRYLPVKPWQKVLLVISLVAFIAGSLLPYHTYGTYVMAAALAGTGVWLMRFDMARKAIKRKGIHRYSATNLLLGYAWLLITGAIMTYGSLGLLYDAVLHSFFIGFVMSMIFAHAPIILPGILKFTFQPFHPVLWIWAVLLHTSLVARMAGDIMNLPIVRQWSGLVNGLVIVGFFGTMVVLTVREVRKAGISAKS